MARPLLHRKGRMVAEDEERIQRCAHYIEDEIEPRDLTSSLYSSRILDADDRCDINSGETRVIRVRRLLEILIMRGPFAYIELIKALRVKGYGHVAKELEEGVKVTCEESRRQTVGVADDRLARIEDLLEKLSLRVGRLESRDKSSDDADDEISHLKKQLSDLKEDTLDQLKEVVEENADLKQQLQDRQDKLEKAEKRILELEHKILDFEDQCGRHRRDIDSLKKQGGVQADRLQRQERKMKTQEEKLKHQEEKLKVILRITRRLDTENRASEMTGERTNVKANTGNDGRMRVVGKNVNKNIKWK